MANAPDKKPPHTVYDIGCSQPVQLMDFIHTLEDAMAKSKNYYAAYAARRCWRKLRDINLKPVSRKELEDLSDGMKIIRYFCRYEKETIL
jgi:hypothetical protein